MKLDRSIERGLIQLNPMNPESVRDLKDIEFLQAKEESRTESIDSESLAFQQYSFRERGALGIIARREGRPVGYALFHMIPKTADEVHLYLDYIYTLPQARKELVINRLLDAIRTEADAREAKCIEWSASGSAMMRLSRMLGVSERPDGTGKSVIPVEEFSSSLMTKAALRSKKSVEK